MVDFTGIRDMLWEDTFMDFIIIWSSHDDNLTRVLAGLTGIFLVF
ncbi:MAG: hypothetical protein ACJ718_10955 [Nitrososphaeraceae archaeon]